MKPMFTMSGQVINVYVTPKGISKKSGEEYGGDDKVQILGDIPLDNGESRKELIEIRTTEPQTFLKLIGKPVSLPISFYAPAKGSVIYFLPKGHTVAPLAS
ncbi:hypothetical protein JHD50_09255 [Sulfurimonas sp. MAG313]|nr:hypothetical protein [Sulfurimonas sp. MAG313]MDF1881485.1 hypothetical protein [Sulfurimonas sp. MAG313]